MITRSEVRSAVNEATLKFEECWSFLASMKAGKLPSEKDMLSITQFQPHLAQAIFDLSSLYCRLAAEKEYWVKRKVHLSPLWFKRRMRFLDSQQTVAEQSIQIGKSLGDGFAWFFYQNNRQFLLEHLKQPEQLLIPSGIGGAAELEVVKNLPLANGQFLLYHGITSILRLGDFSLIDIKDGLRVATVGEIKAGKPSDGKLDIALLFPGNKDELDARIKSTKKNAPIAQQGKGVVEGLIPSARDRLVRQIKRLAESQSRINSKPDKKLALEMDDRIKEFDSFLSSINAQRPMLHQLGNSLLLVGVQLPRGTLYDRLDKKRGRASKHKFAGLENAALALMIQGSANNSIFVGSWFFRDDGKLSHRPGMTHPIWWPVTADSIRRVLFQEVLVMTILNPAHLLDAIQSKGYAVKVDWPRSFVAEKLLCDRMMSLQGIPHYLELLQHYFFSETDVIGFLQQVEDQLPKMPPAGEGQISLHIEQHFGRPLE